MCENRNNFCYVCGLLLNKKKSIKFANHKVLVEKFNRFFNRTYSISKWYEPEYVCPYCSLGLNKWKTETLPFLSPMQWHYQLYHKEEDCYFCQTNVVGHHFKTRHNIKYSNVLTVTKPIPRDRQSRNCTKKVVSSESSDDNWGPTGNEAETSFQERHFVSNNDFQDLVRNLGLSRRQTEDLGSQLKNWHLTDSDFKITFFRDNPFMLFEQLFKADEVNSNLVYCSDIDELFASLNHTHLQEEWRLFIDGSCKSKYI